MSIDSVPDGASIELNGKFVGHTPSKFSLDPGRANIVIRKSGFVAWTENVELMPSASVTLRPELKVENDNSHGVFRAGASVSAPVVLYKADPEYTEAARNAKYSGTVVLQLVVDSTGKARDIRVIRGLGLGLDEKAIEAVNKWKFRPGVRNGQPVAVMATIEMNFRLH